jgi:hypothetical protein
MKLLPSNDMGYTYRLMGRIYEVAVEMGSDAMKYVRKAWSRHSTFEGGGSTQTHISINLGVTPVCDSF